MVMGRDSCPKVVGSNPGTVYWMDIFSHIFVVKICNVCLKRPKINKKRPGLTHLKNNKKYIYKNYSKLRLNEHQILMRSL